MIRRPDKSLVRIYKDLMISKRQLIDLRQSVSKTLHRLNQNQPRNPTSILAKKKMCLGCKKFHGAGAHHCKPPPVVFNCQNCHLNFPTRQTLEKHESQSHRQCRYCHERFNEHPSVHEAQTCGQTRIDCEKCGAKVKRKDINDHIVRCCFNNCLKCGKIIYYKALSYHVQKCREVRADQVYPQMGGLMKTKKLLPKKYPYSEQARQTHYIPCAMQR